MIQLTVENRQGAKSVFECAPRGTLMEAIRDQGVEDEFALCGGCCSCATCHVVIDPAQAVLLPPPSEAELDLLEDSDHRESGSRLSCQVALTAEIERLDVRIAEIS